MTYPVLLFLLTLCAGKSAGHRRDGLLCCMSCLLGLQLPEGLFVPVGALHEDDPRAGDWLQELTGVRARDFGSRCPLFPWVSSLDTWGLFLSTWLSQQHCQTSYTSALGSQQHKSENFQALLRLEARIGRATFLLQSWLKQVTDQPRFEGTAEGLVWLIGGRQQQSL